jgi:hypothetical protein
MGFFKKLGKSLKSVSKMISIKNVGKIASGKYGEIGKEFVDRSLSSFMPSHQSVKISNTTAKVVNTVTSKKSGNPPTTGTEVIGQIFGEIGAESTESTMSILWERHKKKIFIGLGILTLGITYLIFRNRSKNRKPTYKRR